MLDKDSPRGRPWREMRALARLTLAAGTAASLLVACPRPGVSPGDEICNDKRRALDCASEVAYQGVKTEGKVAVLDIASASGSFADTALRDINERVERYVAGQKRLCGEYNACVVDGPTYYAEAKEARAHLADMGPLIEKTKSRDPEARVEAAEKIVEKVTGRTLTPVQISVAVEAILPESAGKKELIVPANYPLPTGASVVFQFVVSGSPAHVYLFQVDPEKKVSVLFPDERISVKNPITADMRVRIPEKGLRFRIDEKGLGTENVYIIASRHPLTKLEQTLRKFASGSLEDIQKDPQLAEFTALEPGRPNCEKTRDLTLVAEEGGPAPRSSSQPQAKAAECARTRGLVLDAEAPKPNARAQHSLEARTVAGDDTLVKVFRFQHVTEADFARRLEEYNAPTPAGEKTRGISIEN